MENTFNDLYKAVVAISKSVASAKDSIERKIADINFDTLINSTKIQTGYNIIQNSVILTIVTTNSNVTNVQAASNAAKGTSEEPQKKSGAYEALASIGDAVKHVNSIYTFFKNAKEIWDSINTKKDPKTVGGPFGSPKAVIALRNAFGTALRTIRRASTAVRGFITQGRLAAVMTRVWTGVQTLFNLILSANPIVLIVLGIAALIAMVVGAIIHFDQWGSALLIFMGPIGRIINAFKIFYDNWESIKKAFQTEGILGGLKRIGKVLLDIVLKPLQQILELISKIPLIGGLAKSGAESIKDLRKSFDLVRPGEESGNTKTADEPNASSASNPPFSIPGFNLVRPSEESGTTGTTKEPKTDASSVFPYINISAGIQNQIVTGKQITRNTVINDTTKSGSVTTDSIAAGGTKNTQISIDFKSLIGVLNIHANSFSEGVRSMEDQVTDALLRVLGSAEATAG